MRARLALLLGSLLPLTSMAGSDALSEPGFAIELSRGADYESHITGNTGKADVIGFGLTFELSDNWRMLSSFEVRDAFARYQVDEQQLAFGVAWKTTVSDTVSTQLAGSLMASRQSTNLPDPAFTGWCSGWAFDCPPRIDIRESDIGSQVTAAAKLHASEIIHFLALAGYQSMGEQHGAVTEAGLAFGRENGSQLRLTFKRDERLRDVYLTFLLSD